MKIQEQILKIKKMMGIITEGYSGYGVADRYFDQAFFKAPDDRPVEEPEGKLVGYVSWNGAKNPARIYQNPKSLDKFENQVRAISDDKGNLYVAQNDGYFDHRDIGEGINEGGQVSPENFGYMITHIHWFRLGNSNIFAPSHSYEEFSITNPDQKSRSKEMIQKLQQNFPNYKFVLRF